MERIEALPAPRCIMCGGQIDAANRWLLCACATRGYSDEELQGVRESAAITDC
jgi:hypothetical protein